MSFDTPFVPGHNMAMPTHHRSVARRGFVSPQVVKWLLIAGVVVVAAAWYRSWKNPPAIETMTARRADVWAVTQDVKPLAALGVVGLNDAFGDLALGGNHTLAVVRDNAQGAFLIVEAAVNRRFLAPHQKGRSDEFRLPATAIKLVTPDGQKHEPLFLTGSFRPNSVRLNLTRFTVNSPMPFDGPSLAQWRSAGQRMGELRPVFRIDDVLQNIEGEQQFAAPSGLAVQLKGDGPNVVIAWDAGSSGWRASYELEESVDPFGAYGTWNVRMVFPIPAGAGAATLEVHGVNAGPVVVPGG